MSRANDPRPETSLLQERAVIGMRAAGTAQGAPYGARNDPVALEATRVDHVCEGRIAILPGEMTAYPPLFCFGW